MPPRRGPPTLFWPLVECLEDASAENEGSSDFCFPSQFGRIRWQSFEEQTVLCLLHILLGLEGRLVHLTPEWAAAESQTMA